jgi:iron complex outermembrane recepter protein
MKQQNKKFILKMAISTLCCAINAVAVGQTSKLDSAKRVAILQPISVSALRATNAPFVKTEITQQQIATQNTGVDLPVLLNQTTGLVSFSDAGAGTGYTGLRLRGSDITRINVTLNGVPVNDAESQGVFFVNFPDLASSAQSIQIQRGVGSSTNGPGAFGGSININSLDLPSKKYVTAGLDNGTFNTLKTNIKLGTGTIKNKFNCNARLSRIKSNGFVRNGFSELLGGQFTAAYTPLSGTNFTFNYMGGHERTGQAWNGVPQDSLITNRTINELGIKEDGTFYNNQTDNYQQHYFQFLFNQKLNRNWQFNLTPYVTLGKGFYEEYKLKQTYNDYGLPNYVDPINNNIITSGSLIRQLWLSNALAGSTATLQGTFRKVNISVGININQYDGEHFGIVKSTQYVNYNTKYYDLNSAKQDKSIYGKLSWRVQPKTQLFADLQYRKVDYVINGFRKSPNLKHDLNFDFFNPKMGITHILKQKQKQTQQVFASIAFAGKEPNRDDLENSNSLNLAKPERLLDVELGYLLKGKLGSLNANIYHMQYANQLVLNGKVNDVGAYTRINVPNSFRRGIEVEATFKTSEMADLSGNIAVSQNKLTTFNEFVYNYDTGVEDEFKYTNTTIAFAPSIVAGYQFNFYPSYFYNETKKVQLSLLGKYVSKQYLDNTESNDRVINPFHTLDVLLAYNTNQRINFRAGFRNLFNAKFESNGYTFSDISAGVRNNYNYYFPQAGITGNIGFTLNF